ncbi:MAG TPA: 2-amino-4-hydroxy-6-hydroxymethyldihydropteridine diphosphokinase [Acidimicrobiia bacterium]
MTRYAIGLGSNLGDRLGHLSEAVGEIGAAVSNHVVAPLYETEPVGGPDQDPYLNTVMVVEADLSAPEMLDELQTIELAHQRERVERWGPRTLDLDLLASDGPEYSDARLTLPHPRASEREFVLRPLAEVWPDAVVGQGLTAAEALTATRGQGVDRLARDWLPPMSPTLPRLLVGGQLILVVAVALAIVRDGAIPEQWLTPGTVTGVGLVIAGLALALPASRRLGSALTPNPVPRAGSSLVVVGPYRLARHPIYGGISLMLIGAALVFGSIWALGIALATIPYFWVKSSFEERQLRMRFAGYQSYRQAVRRRLIPFLI